MVHLLTDGGAMGVVRGGFPRMGTAQVLDIAQSRTPLVGGFRAMESDTLRSYEGLGESGFY